TVILLDRPRHADIVAAVRSSGARIKLISDGDVWAAMATALPEAGIDLMLGKGGAPEGVLAAAALRCLGGELQGRLAPADAAEAQRAAEMLGTDPRRILRPDDLVRGEDVIFAATGITSGDLLRGVTFSAGGLASTHSIAMRYHTGTVRHVHAQHRLDRKPIVGA
ncbi:MAG TPA: fructose-bisphosphatase class II, partial [Bacillota bacterium]|nr:fructose-bisphosphatase class II [Bacillota bacterium]